MSLINEPTIEAVKDAGRQAAVGVSAASSLRFVPRELAVKCRKLVDSYHAMHNYACLPDMLWHSDARDIIECHRDLTKIFKNASKTRCAKRANDAFLLIATVIVSVEVLARDFAGWGKRFPSAKREAERLLADFPPRQRRWLLDMYLYPPLGVHREFAGALVPSLAAEQAMARN
jgi:hypothetical protein